MSQKNPNVPRGVYLPSEIQQMLGISRSSTYNYLELVYKHQSPFIIFKIGKMYRVQKESFDNWFKNHQTENGQSSLNVEEEF